MSVIFGAKILDALRDGQRGPEVLRRASAASADEARYTPGELLRRLFESPERDEEGVVAFRLGDVRDQAIARSARKAG
jgi:hypothetical protein